MITINSCLHSVKNFIKIKVHFKNQQFINDFLIKAVKNVLINSLSMKYKNFTTIPIKISFGLLLYTKF